MVTLRYRISTHQLAWSVFAIGHLLLVARHALAVPHQLHSAAYRRALDLVPADTGGIVACCCAALIAGGLVVSLLDSRAVGVPVDRPAWQHALIWGGRAGMVGHAVTSMVFAASIKASTDAGEIEGNLGAYIWFGLGLGSLIALAVPRLQPVVTRGQR